MPEGESKFQRRACGSIRPKHQAPHRGLMKNLNFTTVRHFTSLHNQRRAALNLVAQAAGAVPRFRPPLIPVLSSTRAGHAPVADVGPIKLRGRLFCP